MHQGPGRRHECPEEQGGEPELCEDAVCGGGGATSHPLDHLFR